MTKEELEKLQALSEPQPVPGNGEEQPRWDEQGANRDGRPPHGCAASQG